ncbi:hypothetical protein [Mycobacterium malmoense]|uniref:hypothetical protein n=1 Tax=Mycobacterium malmoense TaxID=1780 RepID=UPI000B011EAF|nr:hypothetical protein [Mycobacterium malmoense]
MSRTDRRGRGLKAFLQAEIVGDDILLKEVQNALDIKPSKWHGDSKKNIPPRHEADDFPNTEELRRIADHYELGDDGYLNLLVEFGWIESRPDAPGYTSGPPMPRKPPV